MARKRKAHTVEAPQEPEPVQPVDPEPQQPESEQPEPEEINETLEEEAEEEVIEEEEVEEEEEEEEEEEVDEEEENKNDVVSENIEQQTQITENPDGKPADVANGAELTTQNSIQEKEEEGLEEEPLEKVLEPFSKDQLLLLIKESVSKHPDIMEDVHKLADADPAHRKIFVHGLGWEASSETITSVYAKYGEIEDCKVVKDNITGKSKGYGFILFKHRDGARRALKEPQKLIEGRMTSCQLASAGPVKAPPPTAVATVLGPPMSEYTQRKIYVSNVSAELDPDKLLEFFVQFGEIEEGPLGLDKQTGKPRGFCLFVYKSVEGAKKALAEPHKNYEGQMLHCQQAVDGPKHAKGGHLQQQHHHQGHQGGGYHHPAKKGRYSGGGGGHRGGHLMAPAARPGGPSMGYNPSVAPAAIGQAVAALLAAQGGGLGIGNLLGGIGAGVNQQGVPPMLNNAGYGGQPGVQGGYGGQPGVQGGYGGQQQMGQPGVRPPHQGGAPYMGHGR